MIDHVWTVFCSRSVVDRETNNVSLHDVIEQFTIGDEPSPDGIIPGRADLMTLWARADLTVPAMGRGRFDYLSPSGRVLSSQEYEIDLSEYRRYRAVTRFHAISVPEAGRYAFRIALWDDDAAAWQTVAEVPVEVTFEPAAANGSHA